MLNQGIISIENNGIAKFSIKSEHVALRAVLFASGTDHHDDPVRECERHMLRGACESLEGQVFILNDLAAKKASVFIIATPDCVTPVATITDKTLIIKTFGYPVSVGHCDAEDSEALVRGWYRLFYRPTPLHAMSNTWGDRNGRARVNDAFVRREIDSAAELGIDVVQIDDGWQKGIPEVFDEDGRRVFDGDFWELKSDIFPNGIKPLAEYAKERSVSLGLWFAPHSRGVYEYFDRDVEVLRKAYNRWGVRYFKLDMLMLPTVEYCYKTEDFLDEVFSFGEEVSVELDVTADKRLGFLASAPYGVIFVENRYTAWKNYYPHRTLRNLWLLSRFIPASKFQFEILNTELNRDKYDKNDPFRPELYDADYLFASVMFSNPLFWMETQFLSSDSKQALKAIIEKWRKYSEVFAFADITPIGDEPSGSAFTGFMADLGDSVHLLLFREGAEQTEYTFRINAELRNAELIHSNAAVDFVASEGSVTAKFEKMRSYAWIKADKLG